MRNFALLASTAALSLALIPVSAFADDVPPALDLVGKIVLGTADGSTLAIQGGQMVGPVTHSAPGVFQMTAADGSKVDFTITEKGTCLYDITFGTGGTVQAGIEVDANKIKTVTYAQVAKQATWTDYTITLAGGDNIVQLLSPDGKLAPTDASSTISTSLTVDDMNAAVTQFQATYCKPMA